jgi:hypothetical protein
MKKKSFVLFESISLFDVYIEEEREFSLIMIGFYRCHILCNSTINDMHGNTKASIHDLRLL